MNDKVVYLHSLYDEVVDKPFYVGTGNRGRAWDKGQRNAEWAKIVIENNHQYQIHIVAENLSVEEAFSLEKSLIKKYGRRCANTGILVNRARGGKNGFVEHTKESRRKISNSLKNHVVSDETREKIRLGNLGKKRSEKTKNRCKISAKNKPTIKEKTKEKLRKITSSLKWLHLNDKTIRVNENDINEFIQKGWVIGRAEFSKLVWISNKNDNTSKRVNVNDLEQYLNTKDWIMGRKISKNSLSNKL